MSQLAPAVERVLLDAGFEVEGNLPLMTCLPGSEQILPVPPGIELILPVADDELLATTAVQHEAYGAPPPDAAAIDRLPTSLAAGGIAVLACTATGEPIGAGVCTVPSEGTTEIAGIAVRAAFRRRGVAGSIVSRLVRSAISEMHVLMCQILDLIQPLELVLL